VVDVTQFVLVGTGGILGAWARFLLSEHIETDRLDTIVVNILGSCGLGALLALSETNPLFLVFGVGFCGAFTTFSTFAFETVWLFEAGNQKQAAIHAVGNLVGALVGLGVGIGITSVV
jgi:CrcB protein